MSNDSPTATSNLQGFQRSSAPRPGQEIAPHNLLGGRREGDDLLGAIAGDEPRSVGVGRDILLAGGSAADAAAAMYFVLTVTRPSAASLGAAGACIIYDIRTNKARALDFAAPAAQPGGPVIAPLLAPRAMQALQGGHGRLRWGQIVGPAEGMARFGTSVSRAFARDLQASSAELLQDADARRLFGRPGGGVATEGQIVEQLDLAASLSAIRQSGAGALYNGALSRQVTEAAARVGAAIGPDALSGALPQFLEPISLPLSDHRIGFMPGFDTRGPYQGLLWALLTRNDRLEDAPVGERLHMIVDADARAETAFAAMLPDGRSRVATTSWTDRAQVDPLLARYSKDRAGEPPAFARPRRIDESGTSLAVIDKDGQAVACGFTLYRPFGLGRVLPGTGIFPAAAPPADLESTALSPTVVWNENTKQVFFAGAGAGKGAATAVVTTALQTVLGKFNVDVSMNIPRLQHLGSPNVVLIERGVGQDARADLSSRGHVLQEIDAFGPLNAVGCTDGMPRRPETCSVRTDSRGSGLALLPKRP